MRFESAKEVCILPAAPDANWASLTQGLANVRAKRQVGRESLVESGMYLSSSNGSRGTSGSASTDQSSDQRLNAIVAERSFGRHLKRCKVQQSRTRRTAELQQNPVVTTKC